MFVLALTGGVACGKSTVCHSLIEELSLIQARYFSCDACVGDLLTESETLRRLSEVAGGQLINADGGVNREWLRDVMFHDSSLRRSVEGILHPEVLKRAEAFISESEGLSPLAVIEVPLLYEVDFPVNRDMVLVVGASERTQIQRLTEIRQLDQKTALGIIEAQTPVQEKINRSDWVIWNDGAIDSLETQTGLIAEKLKRKFI